MDPPDLAQLAICGRSTGFKAIRAEWKSRIGGDSGNVSKRLSSSSRLVSQFFNLRKNQATLALISGPPKILTVNPDLPP
jgi:hypothetical protein